MNLNQLDLVAWSLARIKALSDVPARLFLSRLAALDPTLPRLFGNRGAHDRRALGRVHLLALVGFRDGKARTVLRNVSKRWKRLDISHRQQSMILSASLWTMRRVLGRGFRLADREAWIAYQRRLMQTLESRARLPRQQSA